MIKITINQKIYKADDGAELKPLLEKLGVIFPCKGQGICGKCKIECRQLAPTALDRKFFNDYQLKSGMRLACDKRINSGLDIIIDEQSINISQFQFKKLSECRIAVSLGIQTIEISILDTEIVENVVLENPLNMYRSYSEISEQYSSERLAFSKLLKSCIGKECVELFEKYGAAKAETIAIAGSELYIKILLGLPLSQKISDYGLLVENDNIGLPADNIYFLPAINNYIGGEILCETTAFAENSMLIDCENICVFAFIGKDSNEFSAMWDVNYDDEISLCGLYSAVKTMLNRADAQPIVYLYGKNKGKIIPLIEELNLTHIEKKKNIEYVAKACLNSRFRAKLNKEKARSAYFDLLNSEEFHEYFSISCKPQ